MMYIYHVLINALSIHKIHINLSMILYTHAEHSPTKTTHTKHHMERPPPPPPPPPNTHTHKTTMNSNVYNTDLYHVYIIHARTDTPQ